MKKNEWIIYIALTFMMVIAAIVILFSTVTADDEVSTTESTAVSNITYTYDGSGQITHVDFDLEKSVSFAAIAYDLHSKLCDLTGDNTHAHCAVEFPEDFKEFEIISR